MKKKLKIVISPDSFKGSISARDAAEAVARGLKRGFGDASLPLFPGDCNAVGKAGRIDAVHGDAAGMLPV